MFLRYSQCLQFFTSGEGGTWSPKNLPAWDTAQYMLEALQLNSLQKFRVMWVPNWSFFRIILPISHRSQHLRTSRLAQPLLQFTGSFNPESFKRPSLVVLEIPIVGGQQYCRICCQKYFWSFSIRVKAFQNFFLLKYLPVIALHSQCIILKSTISLSMHFLKIKRKFKLKIGLFRMAIFFNGLSWEKN